MRRQLAIFAFVCALAAAGLHVVGAAPADSPATSAASRLAPAPGPEPDSAAVIGAAATDATTVPPRSISGSIRRLLHVPAVHTVTAPAHVAPCIAVQRRAFPLLI